MTEFREVTDGLMFPEGPIAMPDGSVLVVEIGRRTLTRVLPDGRKEIVAETGGGPNGAAIGPDGKCYICNNGGFEFARVGRGPAAGTRGPRLQRRAHRAGGSGNRDRRGGSIAAPTSMRSRGPNDIVFDDQGGFYFTDLGKVRHPRDGPGSALYYAKADGSLVKEIAFPLITPNGIGLSPDNKTLYAVETEAARLWSWPILSPGELGKEPWPIPHGGKLVRGMGGYQRFDSLALDGEGRICVATLDQRRDHGDQPRRKLGGPCADAGSLDDQHLFRRRGSEDGLHHALQLGPSGGGRLADRWLAFELSE